MGQNIYKLKFELHAEHSNVIGDKAGRHQHTFSIVLYLKAQRKMELYQEMQEPGSGHILQKLYQILS